MPTLATFFGIAVRRAIALVVEWAMAHRQELRENWRRAEHHEPLLTIEPLE